MQTISCLRSNFQLLSFSLFLTADVVQLKSLFSQCICIFDIIIIINMAVLVFSWGLDFLLIAFLVYYCVSILCSCAFIWIIYVRLVFVVVAVVVSIICEEALQATRHQQVDCQVRQGDIRRPHGRHQQLVLYVCRCYCFCSCLDFSHLSVSSSREKIIYTLAYLVYVARCFFWASLASNLSR